MAYKALTSFVGVLCHDFATFGSLLFIKQYLTVSQCWCEFYPKLLEIKPQYLWVLPPEGYGLWVIAVVMGCMGSEVLFPVNQLNGLKNLCDKGVWGM